MLNTSCQKMWNDFIQKNPKYQDSLLPLAEHFCANEKDANALAQLVLEGKKTATCSALVSYRMEQEDLPKADDLYIVTDWAGNAVCITRTKQVDLVKFCDITEQWARKEGEGDLSLAYWIKGHWQFFQEDLKQFGIAPTEDMVLVCEEFEKVFS